MDISIPNIIRRNQTQFHPVVPFDADKSRIVALNLKDSNRELTPAMFNNTDLFSEYTDNLRKTNGADYLMGGYDEWRAVYGRSGIFDGYPKNEANANSNLSTEDMEPRRLHLGVDIWGPAGTPVFAPLGGMVHSFAFNDHFGDYGATIILLHQLDGSAFYTLYGHLSLHDIDRLNEGSYITRGAVLGHFGKPEENGNWPPHLHFQVIIDIGMYKGDYPGVCKFSEREKYLANCPDPELILQMEKMIR